MVKKLSNFSVVIRAKNEERWIGHAIQSALDHLSKPEIVIVDNNSTDKTLEIVKFFAEISILVTLGKNVFGKLTTFSV